MKRRAVERWWGLMTVMGMAASCRDHVPVCGGSECEASLQSAAGAGPHDEMKAGEAGGGGAEPACSSDAECDNDLSCDGEEHCSEGSCAPGEPVDCPNPAMHCQEDANEQCVFDRPSPWLVVGQGNTLAGLPANQLGKQEALHTLASRPASRALGFAGPTVGASGPFALSVSLEEEFLLSAHYFRFGPGLPSTLRLVPDVPDVLETFREPVVSPDSRFALIFDDATGIYLAPLAERQPTFFFPVELGEYYEAAFCEESGTFWRYGDAGVSIVSATADGPEVRSLGGSDTPVFSWEKRFVVLTLADPTSVLVTTCSREGASTVFTGGSEPVIAPGSSALLMNVQEGGQKLFSLEDPSAQVELWSSSVPLASASFSSDGTRLVGSVDDVLHVVDLREPDQLPKSFGLPAGAAFVSVSPEEHPGYQDLVGKVAALVWVPIEGTEDRELFWQPLDLSQEGQSLLLKEQSSSVEFFISKHDVEQVFMADHDGEREQLRRLRLDTQQPLIEELFTVDSSISKIEVAPDGSGLALLTASTLLQSNLYWAAIDRAGKVQDPISLSNYAYNFAFQPWP